MAFTKLLTVLSIVVAASAASMVLHERRTAVPSGFVRRGAAPANKMITLRVGLKSNDAAGLEAKLRSVSSPGSSDFRQWLSMDDVRACILNSVSDMADEQFAGQNLYSTICRHGLGFQHFRICEWPGPDCDIAESGLGFDYSPSFRGEQALCCTIRCLYPPFPQRLDHAHAVRLTAI
jgi:hypothetical protein